MSPSEPESKPPAGPPVPILKAMLIADLAIREEGTGKVSLIGIFEQISAVSFPVRHPTLSVYVKMTDAEGTYDIAIELLRLDDATRLGEGRGTLEAPDRMAVGEIIVRLDNLIFPAAGLYEFRLLANRRYLGSKSFRVVKSVPSGG